MQGQAAADEVRFLSVCLMRAAQAWDPEPPGAFTRRTPYMALCTRSEVYIRLVCPGIGLAGRGDDAPSRRRPYVSQPHGVGSSKFAFESHMSGSHLARQECGCWLVSLQAASPRDNPISGPAEGSLELNFAFLNEIPTPGPLSFGRLGLKRAFAGHNRLTDHNQSNFLKALTLAPLAPYKARQESRAGRLGSSKYPSEGPEKTVLNLSVTTTARRPPRTRTGPPAARSGRRRRRSRRERRRSARGG